MDNLLAYLHNNFGDRIAISGITGDLLVWGVRAGSTVRFLGLSFVVELNAPLSSHGRKLLSSGEAIAAKFGLPFFTIYFPPNLNSNPGATLTINGNSYPKAVAPRIIQNILNTNLSTFGTGKAVNRSTSDAFHEWARTFLPSDYTRVDVDAFMFSNEHENIPKILIEIKRSTAIPPARWLPYVADIRNYYLQMKLAEHLRIDYITLNHNCKDVQVTATSVVGFHKINQISLMPEKIYSDKNLMIPGALLSNLNALLSE